MRVIPSVTDTMVPTLRASVTPLKFSIRCLIRSLISVALMAMSVSYANSLCGQLVGDALEARAQGTVDHEIAGPQDRAADQRGIDVALHADLALEPPLQRGGQRFELSVHKWRGGSDRHVDHALGLVLQLIEESR